MKFTHRCKRYTLETKRMGYARDQQITMLESDGQLMLEKSEF